MVRLPQSYMTKGYRILTEEGFEKIFQVNGKVALKATVNIDTTVQEKNIIYPTDAKLAIKIP